MENRFSYRDIEAIGRPIHSLHIIAITRNLLVLLSQKKSPKDIYCSAKLSARPKNSSDLSHLHQHCKLQTTIQLNILKHKQRSPGPLQS